MKSFKQKTIGSLVYDRITQGINAVVTMQFGGLMVKTHLCCQYERIRGYRT